MRNLEMDKDEFVCPCCGYRGLTQSPYKNMLANRIVRGVEPPYEQVFGNPSYEICACCGFEFGNDDDSGTSEPVSFEDYLINWIDSGCKWFDSDLMQDEWSLENQLDLAKQ